MIFLKHSLKILLSISCSKLQFNYTIWKSFFFLFLPLTSSFFITTYQHSILSKHAHPFSYRNAVDQSVIWSVISLLTNMLSLLQSLYTETFVGYLFYLVIWYIWLLVIGYLFYLLFIYMHMYRISSYIIWEYFLIKGDCPDTYYTF